MKVSSLSNMRKETVRTKNREHARIVEGHLRRDRDGREQIIPDEARRKLHAAIRARVPLRKEDNSVCFPEHTRCERLPTHSTAEWVTSRKGSSLSGTGGRALGKAGEGNRGEGEPWCGDDKPEVSFKKEKSSGRQNEKNTLKESPQCRKSG